MSVKMSLPTVSICIPTYNRADLLDKAIKSALAQVDVLCSIWVADDASTDTTESIIANYSNYSNVHYIKADANRGISVNAERAMKAAQTEYVVRLDSDDVLYPDYCKILVKLLNDYPHAGVAHCAVEEIDIFGSRIRIRKLARTTGYQAPEATLRSAHFGYKVAANICMFRAAALEMLDHIYDHRLGFCEDWDLFVRLADCGWGNVYHSSILAGYRVWRIDDNCNESRKVAEIFGINFILEKTLSNAWQRRGWDTRPITKARYRFVKHHITSLPVGSCIRNSSKLRSLFIQLSNENDRFVNYCYNLKARPFALQCFFSLFSTFLKRFAKTILFR